MILRMHLHDKGCSLGKIWDKPIGPHPLPMYQASYDTSNKEHIEGYLARVQLSILLHEDTGIDHFRDHTEGARWLGTEQILDLEFLKRLE